MGQNAAAMLVLGNFISLLTGVLSAFEQNLYFYTTAVAKDEITLYQTGTNTTLDPVVEDSIIFPTC